MAKNETKAEIARRLKIEKQRTAELLEEIRECRGRKSQLEAEINKSKRGYQLVIRGQVVTGDFAHVRAIAKLLLDNGFWYFDLIKRE